ncbi:YcxB family protein [Leptospira sp. WS39.C2]
MKNKKLLFSLSLLVGISIPFSKSIFTLNSDDRVTDYLMIFCVFTFIYLILKALLSQNKKHEKLTYINQNTKSSKKTKEEKNQLEFEFKINLTDIQKFHKFLNTQTPFYLKLPTYLLQSFIILTIFYVCLELAFQPSTLVNNPKLYTLTFLIIIQTIVALFTNQYMFKKQFSGVTKTGVFHFSFNQMGVSRSGLYFQSFYEWKCFESIVKTDDSIYFLFSDYEALILPKAEIPPNFVSALEGLMSQNFKITKD